MKEIIKEVFQYERGIVEFVEYLSKGKSFDEVKRLSGTYQARKRAHYFN